MRVPVSTPNAPAASGSYSQGIRAGNLLFLAGQAPIAVDGAIVRGTIADQVRRTLANLDAVAKAAGASLRDAVQVRVYLTDLAHFDDMDAEYRLHFVEPLPARTTIQSDLRDFDVEIDAVIALPAT